MERWAGAAHSFQNDTAQDVARRGRSQALDQADRILRLCHVPFVCQQGAPAPHRLRSWHLWLRSCRSRPCLPARQQPSLPSRRSDRRGEQHRLWPRPPAASPHRHSRINARESAPNRRRGQRSAAPPRGREREPGRGGLAGPALGARDREDRHRSVPLHATASGFQPVPR
jgi:hypothetical protein